MSILLLSFLPTWLVFTTACISPGPNTFLVMSTALEHSRKSALWLCLGLAIGSFIWSFISLAGVNHLLLSFPILIKVIAFTGGFYLIYLATKTAYSIFSNIKLKPATKVLKKQASSQKKESLKNLILKGLMTTLTNPKVAILWLSLSPIVPIAAEQTKETLLYSSGVFLIVFSVYGIIGWMFSFNKAQNIFHKYSNMINACFSIIFMCLGLVIIFKYAIN